MSPRTPTAEPGCAARRRPGRAGRPGRAHRPSASALLRACLVLLAACHEQEPADTAPAPPSTCADPAARLADGPMARVLDGDWGAQQVPDNLAWRYAGLGVAIEDFDGDGTLDVYLPQNGQDHLYLNDGDGVLVDVTATALPAGATRVSSSATPADIDGDDDVDLYVGVLDGPDVVLLNDGAGHFDEAPASLGLAANTRPTLGAAFADMDTDGDLDLVLNYLGVWSPSWITAGPEDDFPIEDVATLEALLAQESLQVLFENVDGTFVDVSERLPREPVLRGLTYAAGWHDLDQDGAPDLYFVNDYREEFHPWTNLFLHNDGTGQFADQSAERGLDLRVCGMGLAVGDMNTDGAPDLLVSSWDDLVLLESQGGGWYESDVARGVVPDDARGQQVAWGPQLEDLDNDGDLDAVVLFGDLRPDIGFQDSKSLPAQPDALYLQAADGSAADVADAWGLADTGVSRSVALADLDGDGFLDMIRRDLTGPALLDRSRCDDSGWLRVRLRGHDGNTRGIGARIEVDTGGHTLVRWVRAGGTGLAGAGPAEVHFGLGDAHIIDALRVYWPDGAVSGHAAQDADRVLVIESD